MDIKKTTDLTVVDIVLQHVRQNATLPMAWDMSCSFGDYWVLEFTSPQGSDSEEFIIHANTSWQQLLNSIAMTEEHYRAKQNERLGLTPIPQMEVA